MTVKIRDPAVARQVVCLLQEENRRLEKRMASNRIRLGRTKEKITKLEAEKAQAEQELQRVLSTHHQKVSHVATGLCKQNYPLQIDEEPVRLSLGHANKRRREVEVVVVVPPFQVIEEDAENPRKRLCRTMPSDTTHCAIHPYTKTHTTLECRQYDRYRQDPEGTVRRAAEIREAKRQQGRQARLEQVPPIVRSFQHSAMFFPVEPPF